MTVGVTMIVRNEERVLTRCLESFREFVDELVIVDTGSTDGTKAIAEEFDARIFDFEWIDDFSAARQFALDQATTDWVCWVDADEVVHDAERIRSVVESAGTSFGRIDLLASFGRDGRGQPTFTFWRERCVRNDGASHWVGHVHEVLVGSGRYASIQSDQVVVEHIQEGDREGRPGRNLRILEKDYLAANGKLDSRMLFYFGRELADAGESSRSIEILTKCVATSNWNDERYRAQIQIAELYQRNSEFEQAIDAYLSALKIYSRWPDAYFGLASIASYKKDWANVLHWADIGRSLPIPNTIFFINRRAYEFDWLIHYTNALYRTGQRESAVVWTRHALEIFPDDPWHLDNLLLFEEQVSPPNPPILEGITPFPPESSG